jgi:ribulose-bisphosphate carboxylase large chain
VGKTRAESQGNRQEHPYIGKPNVASVERCRAVVAELNRDRGNARGEAVEATYYFEAHNGGGPLAGLTDVARMVLEHGTLKSWHQEGDSSTAKPKRYDEHMSWVVDVQLLGRDTSTGVERGLVTVAYPLAFFDRRDDGRFPMATLMEAVASEPMTAFVRYRSGRVVDLKLPECLRTRCPGQLWPHARVREYLGLADEEPLIGTIVKPKTGLTPELFARAVVEAAEAGARFVKADENMHLSLADIPRYVGAVVSQLHSNGFDLGRGELAAKRFLFAPHISTDSDRLREHAAAAVSAGANALMFTPYYSGGFLTMAAIAEEFDVPVYAHTAGMNVMSGSPTWGIDPRVFYMFAGLFGAAFMQLPTAGGYLRPLDEEKGPILECLTASGLSGDRGMTLAIAGGLGPGNIGANMRQYGSQGRMYLAGTSVYAHPRGPAAGVRAIALAYRAFREEGLTEVPGLVAWAMRLGTEAEPLLQALSQ